MCAFNPSEFSTKWPKLGDGNLPRPEAFMLAKDSPLGFAFRYATRPAHIFSLQEQEALYNALVRVTTDSFGADMTEYWRLQYSRGYFERLRIFCVIEDSDGSIIGWSSAHTIQLSVDRHVTYLDSTGVVQRAQGHGLVSKWLCSEEFRNILRPDNDYASMFVAARTENPIMHRVLERIATQGSWIFPMADKSIPNEIQETALSVAGWLGQDDRFDPCTLRISDAYDALDELYGDLPSSGDETIDKVYRDNLGPLDAYLICGRYL